MEEETPMKVTLSIYKPKELITDEFDIFTMTYLGKLTAIVDYFESISENDVHYCLSEKDQRGNTPLDVACFLGFKNLILYFMKWNADALSLDSKQRN